MVGSATQVSPGVFSKTCAVVKKDGEGRPVNGDAFTPTPIDQKEFRGVLSQFATGVAVITTEDQTGDQAGMTVSSFTSVSLDPPLILFCAKEGSSTLAEIEENGHFAVNILRDDQKALCYQFAKGTDAEKFKDVPTRDGMTFGDPLLEGAIANIECKLHSIGAAGDHKVVFGEVVGLSRTPEHDLPLLFWDGKAEYPKV